jgi:hypothetical protein
MRIIARRRRRPQRDAGTAQVLADIAAAAGEWAGNRELRLAGSNLQPIEPDAAGVGAYLHEVRSARSHGETEVFVLADGSGPDATALFYDWDEWPSPGFERVWLPYPPRRLSADSRSPERIRQTVRLTDFVGETFGALSAFTEDFELIRLTRGRRALELAAERVPEELREFANLPTLDPSDLITQLLVPEEFDRRYAPEGIWWINYWTAPIVETLGVDRIRAAPWAEIHEHRDGTLLLVVTEHILDPRSPEDLAALDHLIRELGIRDAQERHRI